MSLIGKLGKNTLKKKITPVKYVECMQQTYIIKKVGVKIFVKKNRSWRSVELVIPESMTTLHGPERTII